jgi:hypothetical protein
LAQTHFRLTILGDPNVALGKIAKPGKRPPKAWAKSLKQQTVKLSQKKRPYREPTKTPIKFKI